MGRKRYYIEKFDWVVAIGSLLMLYILIWMGCFLFMISARLIDQFSFLFLSIFISIIFTSLVFKRYYKEGDFVNKIYVQEEELKK